MDLETIRIRQSTIKRKMKRFGHEQLAEDAAQEYILDILEGKRANQTLDQFIIDFFRKHFGDSRCENGKYQFFYGRTLSVEMFEDELSYESTVEHDIWINELVGDDEILKLYFIMGYTQKEISKFYRVSNSRISQIIHDRV